MLSDLFSDVNLNSEQVTAIVIVSISVVSLLIFLMTALVTSTWKSVSTAKLEIALKRQMIDRGMSAEAIAQVMNARAAPQKRANVPCACEVVVESDDEWHTALVLQVAGDQYYVHYVGTEMNENEWVGEGRVRFPAGSNDPEQIARFHSFANGALEKEPMQREV
jgi:hypothetical protein